MINLVLLLLLLSLSVEVSANGVHEYFSSEHALLRNRSLASGSSSGKWEEGMKDVLLVRKEFEATLKSCLGSYCMMELFTNLKIERIGFLSPDYGHILFLSNIAKKWDSDDQQMIVPSQSVPAYGYGRNHGWTKIVRFTDNLVLQAFKITKAKFQESGQDSANEALFKQSFEIHVRLISLSVIVYIDYSIVASAADSLELSVESCFCAYGNVDRCRESWNLSCFILILLLVFFDDLMKRPYFELQRIFSFISQKRMDDGKLKGVLEVASPLLERMRLQAFSRRDIPASLLAVSVSVFRNEMEISKGLTQWPCRSFKSLVNGLSESSPPIVSFHALATNCSDPFVKCSVRFDLDEQS